MTPEQLLWDGDKIYLASKRSFKGLVGHLANRDGDAGAYTILNYTNGEVIATHSLQVVDVPMMSVLNDKLLVLTDGGRKANFFAEGGLRRSPSFFLDAHGGTTQGAL